MPKMSGYVKKFKVKEGDNKLMSFCIDDKKLLEKYCLNKSVSIMDGQSMAN